MRIGEGRTEASIPKTHREAAKVLPLTLMEEERGHRLYKVTNLIREPKIIKVPKIRRRGKAE